MSAFKVGGLVLHQFDFVQHRSVDRIHSHVSAHASLGVRTLARTPMPGDTSAFGFLAVEQRIGLGLCTQQSVDHYQDLVGQTCSSNSLRNRGVVVSSGTVVSLISPRIERNARSLRIESNPI